MASNTKSQPKGAAGLRIMPNEAVYGTGAQFDAITQQNMNSAQQLLASKSCGGTQDSSLFNKPTVNTQSASSGMERWLQSRDDELSYRLSYGSKGTN